MAAQQQHLSFNHRCKCYGLIPPSLQARPLINSYRGRRIAMISSRQYLGARIAQNAAHSRRLQTDLFFQRRQLEYTLRPSHTASLHHLKERAVSQLTEKTKARQKRKFDNLLDHAHRKTHPPPPPISVRSGW